MEKKTEYISKTPCFSVYSVVLFFKLARMEPDTFFHF